MSENAENIKINNELIKYFDNEASERETDIIKDWFDSAPENEEYFNKVKNLWDKNLDPYEKKRFETDKGWNNFSKKYNFPENIKTEHKEKKAYKIVIVHFLKIAAVIAIGIIIWKTGLFETKTVSIATAETKEEIILPDNSTVFLNKNSEISFNKNLVKKNKREVKFSGEAFFDVEYNPKVPFIIYANDVKVEVKGTSFNIKAYPGKDVEIVVKTGIVSVTKMSENEVTMPVLINKGEKIEVDTTETRLNIEENDDPNYLSWKTELYTFDSVYISKVIRTLEHGFDAKIIVKDPEFNNCMLVANFDKLNLNEIFGILQRTYDISVTNKNDTVYIEGKGCN